jgi:hypothetical protein
MNSKEIGERLEQIDIELHENPSKYIDWLNFQNIVSKAMKKVDPSNKLSISEAVSLMSENDAVKLLREIEVSNVWIDALLIASSIHGANMNGNTEYAISKIESLTGDMAKTVLRAFVFQYGKRIS